MSKKLYHGYDSAIPNTIHAYKQTKEAHLLDKTITKKPYQLHLGDCTKILKNIPDNSVDLVVTDPPYKYAHFHGSSNNKHLPKNLIKNHQILNGITNGFSIPEVTAQLYRVSKHINWYIWCSNLQVLPLLSYITSKYHCHYSILTWYKNNQNKSRQYLKDEFCLYFYDNSAYCSSITATKQGHYTYPLNQFEESYYHHPTVKPIFILRNLIINSSKPNDVVLDPFVGSGSTGVASLMIRRRFIGIDILKHCIQTSQKRLTDSISADEGLIKYEIQRADGVTKKDAKNADSIIRGLILGQGKKRLIKKEQQIKQLLNNYQNVKTLSGMPNYKTRHLRNLKIAKLYFKDPKKWSIKALHERYWNVSLSSISDTCNRYSKKHFHKTANQVIKDRAKKQAEMKVKAKNNSNALPIRNNNIMYLHQQGTSYRQLSKKYGLSYGAIKEVAYRMRSKNGDNYTYQLIK